MSYYGRIWIKAHRLLSSESFGQWVKWSYEFKYKYDKERNYTFRSVTLNSLLDCRNVVVSLWLSVILLLLWVSLQWCFIINGSFSASRSSHISPKIVFLSMFKSCVLFLDLLILCQNRSQAYNSLLTSAYSFLVLNCISIYFIAIQLAISTLQLKPNCVPKFIKLTSNLVKPLCTGSRRNGKVECTVINDSNPFFQLRMLYLLCSLCINNQIWNCGTGMPNISMPFEVHFLCCL